jgi:zinc protease
MKYLPIRFTKWVALALLGVAGWTTCWSADLRMPDYQRITLDNGTVLLLMERHDVPLVAVHAVVNGGALLDAKDKMGTAALLSDWLMKGAGGRTAQQWAEALAQVGANLEVSSSMESIDVEGSFLAKDQSLMIAMLADLLQRPALDEQAFNDLKQRHIEELRATKDGDIGSLSPLYASAALFGAHPYARAVSGSGASVARISADDARALYRDYFGADRLIVAIAGDFDAATLAMRLREKLSAWPRAQRALPTVTTPKALQGRRVVLVNAPGATQTYFWIGNVGMARNDSRRIPLSILNTLLGGRYTSLLNTQLRIKSGLTYGARSQFRAYAQPGSWNMYSFTQTATTMKAIDMMLDTYALWRKQGVNAASLLSAQKYMLGQYVTSYETAAQWAATMARLEFTGLSRDEVDEHASRIRAVTVADANRALNAVFPEPDHLLMVVMGDAAKIRQQVAKYGPVTEIALSAPQFFVR